MPKNTITTEYQYDNDGKMSKKISTEEYNTDKCYVTPDDFEPEIEQVLECEAGFSFLDVIVGIAGVMSIIASSIAIHQMLKK